MVEHRCAVARGYVPGHRQQIGNRLDTRDRTNPRRLGQRRYPQRGCETAETASRSSAARFPAMRPIVFHVNADHTKTFVMPSPPIRAAIVQTRACARTCPCPCSRRRRRRPVGQRNPVPRRAPWRPRARRGDRRRRGAFYLAAPWVAKRRQCAPSRPSARPAPTSQRNRQSALSVPPSRGMPGPSGFSETPSRSPRRAPGCSGALVGLCRDPDSRPRTRR